MNLTSIMIWTISMMLLKYPTENENIQVEELSFLSHEGSITIYTANIVVRVSRDVSKRLSQMRLTFFVSQRSIQMTTKWNSFSFSSEKCICKRILCNHCGGLNLYSAFVMPPSQH